MSLRIPAIVVATVLLAAVSGPALPPTASSDFLYLWASSANGSGRRTLVAASRQWSSDHEQRSSRSLVTISTRIAQPNELPELSERYRAWGYHAAIAPADIVFVAERVGRCIGLVRRTFEHDVFMLRGMFVDPSEQRRGVGSLPLQAFTQRLAGAECYCIPFAHLPGFYARVGFGPVTGASVPSALAERLDHSRLEGHDVILMRRLPDITL